MNVEVLFDAPVSPNLKDGDSSVTCSYPLTARLFDGSICCVYRQGSWKHSPDGIAVMQTSEDLGASWSSPRTVFDGRHLRPGRTVITAAPCQTQDGGLLVAFGAVDGLESNIYVFGEEGKDLPRPLLVTHSKDNGQSWDEPTSLSLPPLLNPGVTARPFVLPDGRLCLPLECKLTPEGPNGTAMTFSHDDGTTFGPPIIVAADRSDRLNLCDGRFTCLPEGRLLAMLWTFRQDDEETIEVHQSFSSDRGRTWTEPTSTGFVGQITAPLALADGRLIAASNYRLPPEGIRLWISLAAGNHWESQPVQMWDAGQSRVLAHRMQTEKISSENDGVWEALEQFTFGTPDLVDLEEDIVLMTYYATIDNISHIRACQFKLHS